MSTLLQSLSGRKASPLLVKLALLGTILLAGFLRFYRIDALPVWLDEAFSIWMGARRSIFEIIRYIIDIDQHPPLYYLLLHAWMSLGGTGAYWMRSFSAWAGILTIPAIFFFGGRLTGDVRVGLIAALILAISPFQVSYGQETRTYALLTLSVTLSLWMLARLLTDPRASHVPMGDQLELFWRAWKEARRAAKIQADQEEVGYRRDFRQNLDWVQKPTGRRWPPFHVMETDLSWLGYMVFTAAVIYQHNTAIFYPIGVNLFVLGWIALYAWRKRRFPQADLPEGWLQPPSFWNWFWAQVGVGLLWSPWIVAFFAQAAGMTGEFWIPKPTLNTVLDTLKSFFSDWLPDRLALKSLVWWYFMFMAGMGILYFRKRLGGAVLLAGVFLAPILGELLASIWQPIFYVRTLIWAPITIYVLMAAGFAQLRFRAYILAALAILVTINGLSLQNYYRFNQKEEWNKVAEYMARNVQDGDMIVFNAGWTQIPFDYYFLGYNRPVDEVGAPETMFEFGVLEPKMRQGDIPRLRTLLEGRQRVWLVYSHNWYTDPNSLVIRTIGESMKQVQKRDYLGVEVYLFSVQ